MDFEQLMHEEPVFLIMAIVGSALFLIKMVLLMIAGDGDGSEFDAGELDTPDHPDSGASFSLVSLQSILAFFMGAGWMGLAARIEWEKDKFPSLMIAASFGFAMMLFSAFLTFKIKRLNATPTFNIKNAVGLTGRAYTDIPKKGDGVGQVEVTINGKQEIRQALSQTDSIKSFSPIKIVQVDDSGNLIVEPT